MPVKELFSAIAISLTLLAYYPYVRSIYKGKTRPHFFSWLIWSLTTFIVFFAQIEGGAGVGAWPVGVSGALTFYITFLAYLKKADINIKTVDYIFLLAGISAIPLWLITANPMWAVILVTLIDVCGFGPTIRKAYYFPEQENLTFYLIFFIRCNFVILALEYYSVTTILFPLTIGISSLLMVLLLIYKNAKMSGNHRHIDSAE